jgi:hypothetical protein
LLTIRKIGVRKISKDQISDPDTIFRRVEELGVALSSKVV